MTTWTYCSFCVASASGVTATALFFLLPLLPGRCFFPCLGKVDTEGRHFRQGRLMDDSSDEELFSTGINALPRDVIFDDVANSKYGRNDALSPVDHFPPGVSTKAIPNVIRFINRYDKSEALIYTDGACLDNGAAKARGGCAFVFKPTYSEKESGVVSLRLEDQGPGGEVYQHTSNRAELRAVIAAVRFREWYGEGFKSIVIATDSTYVVNGATDWVRAWMRKDWHLSTGGRVKNRDLWETLLLRIEQLKARGMQVRFWRIPRQWNGEADRAAKDAAANLPVSEKFCDVHGILC
ncbi:Ribonuclease H [Colletotrichum aenigma]|uniref:Ribonuclease H n=1 Tax=Colletotrichum aenigma TaxID=1215731 RepID=UPI0018726B32|nr:Ribonuclease H [Colletotrichum aenigma]KAF5528279.1 Ribonuclease H [Colletotrichum aenigma]